ncbi:hypothetical protein IFM89_036412 [Coptis chinensis]|uniref:Uncharacterized protein n=1 Tax=Coptis chinensis TaxID=261450 RepID=A0A835IGS6_9MAGN|nr:hypothetical protein IFM89_036412 [Coptis chinensis]
MVFSDRPIPCRRHHDTLGVNMFASGSIKQYEIMDDMPVDDVAVIEIAHLARRSFGVITINALLHATDHKNVIACFIAQHANLWGAMISYMITSATIPAFEGS